MPYPGAGGYAASSALLAAAFEVSARDDAVVFKGDLAIARDVFGLRFHAIDHLIGAKRMAWAEAQGFRRALGFDTLGDVAWLEILGGGREG